MPLDGLREALASLRLRPGTTATAVAVLALGIGANAAIFDLVDPILFRALPVSHPEQLVRLFSASSPGGADTGRVSLPFVADYRSATSFSALEVWSDGLPVDVALQGSAERLTAAAVSPLFFECLGLRPSLGRLLGPSDQTTDAAAAVVLSHRMWRRLFAGEPHVPGAIIHVNRLPFVVVGVAPPGFEGLGLDALPDLWLPLARIADAVPAWRDQTDRRSSTFFHAVGRLTPGVKLRTAQAEMDVIASRLGAGKPAAKGPETDHPDWREPWPWLDPADNAAGQATRPLARLLAGAAGLVLVVTAVDVAGLMLACGERRRREIGVRLALGASRWRVVRPLALEALILSATGALGGLAVAHTATRAFLASAPEYAAPGLRAGANVLAPRVLVATALAAAIAAILASVWPALRATRVDPLAILRGDLPAGAAHWLSARGTLVVVQVALSTVLLAEVGVLLRSLWTAAAIRSGADPDHVLVAGIDPSRGGYDKARGAAFAARLDEALRQAPGIVAAGLSTGVPFQGGPSTTVTIDEHDAPLDFVMVTPGYFEALGIPVPRGRSIEPADTAHSDPVAVVNRAFVRHFWPGMEPIGRKIKGFTPRNTQLEAVGVVGDVRTHGLREPPHPVMYVPLAQFYGSFPWQFGLTAVLRTAGPPRMGAATLQNTLNGIDPMLPMLRPRPLAEALGESFAQERLLAGLLGAFAALAIVLAGTGLYGVVTLVTETRIREFGVRVALGALRRDLWRLVVARSMALCALGLVIGTATSFLARRALEPFVFGVSTVDPLALCATSVVLLLVSALAAQAPAHRAATIDPVEALRHQ